MARFVGGGGGGGGEFFWGGGVVPGGGLRPSGSGPAWEGTPSAMVVGFAWTNVWGEFGKKS